MDFRTLIAIPTYNERENLRGLYERIRKVALPADLLIVDDNSPDGTGKIADELACEDPRLFVMHRAGKQGIGDAHQAAIRWAYEHGYQLLVTMDCDFTHLPEDIPCFRREALGHDLVVGSRYLDRKSLRDWNLFRKSLTLAGHFLTKHLLQMPQDATGAFRAYRLDRIPPGIFELVGSKGYSFFFESLYVLKHNGFSIKEIAIDLPARTYGHSKMSPKDAVNSLRLLIRTFFRSNFGRDFYRYTPAVSPVSFADDKAREAWDVYWRKKVKNGGKLYDVIAACYRKLIIKRALNDVLGREFPQGAELLHAGCGGGQVDGDVVKRMRVTALDISASALEQYQKVNGSSARILQASVFNIPLEDESLDGIYNLGVMEHFTEDEIQRILTEFGRVLKPGGKMVLFWPPRFGLSVRALKLTHFALNTVLKKNVQLYPAEITLVSSKEHVRKMVEKAGARLIGCDFGPLDFFTHMIVICQKEQQPEDSHHVPTEAGRVA